MDGPFPSAHAGADDLIGEVLIEGCALLPGLGMAWCGEVAHGVEVAGGVPLEGEGLGDGADGLAGGTKHLARLSAAQMFLVMAITLIDQFPVKVLALDVDDGSDLRRSFGSSRCQVHTHGVSDKRRPESHPLNP